MWIARARAAAAEAYLKFLSTEEAQEIIAKNFYRPSNESILKKYPQIFPPDSSYSPFRRSPRIGPTPTNNSSKTAAYSTRFTVRSKNKRMKEKMPSVNRKVLPGFSLALGYSMFYLSVLVLLPISGLLQQNLLAQLRRVLGGGVDRANPGGVSADFRHFAGRGGASTSSWGCSSPGSWCATNSRSSDCWIL